MKNRKIVLGIDIGGTKTKFGLTDSQGKIYNKNEISTGIFNNPEKLLHEIKEQIFVNTDKDTFEVAGVGIGAPNANYRSGKLEMPPNLPWKGIIEMQEPAQKIFNAPAKITNDANAAALGEMFFGGAKNMKNFVMLTLGTGFGSGIVVDGKICYGHDGMAGELGHTIVVPDGRHCTCGNFGCLETYVSASGMVRTALEYLNGNDNSGLLSKIDPKNLTSKDIFIAANNGDALALKIFDETAEMLGRKMAEIVAYTSPETIFFYGGLANAASLLIEPSKTYMEKFLFPVYKNKVNVCLSELFLSGADTAILGAASLIWLNTGS